MLPDRWRLLGFMIATSGLFTFAWTAGILIGVMNRFHDVGSSVQGEMTPERPLQPRHIPEGVR